MSRQPEVCICSDDEQMNGFLLECWQEKARDALNRRGRFTVALCGGQTPVSFYRALGSMGVFPWEQTFLFLTDERFVPRDHPDSNALMIEKNLLNAIRISPQNVNFLQSRPLSLEQAARDYEHDLRVVFENSAEDWPRFDLVLLGMGEDGHTASIFPGMPWCDGERWVLPVPEAPGRKARITLTLPVLNNADTVVFIVKGHSKRDVVKNILAGNSPCPAAKVILGNASCYIVMDKDAAGDISLK